MTCDGNDNDDDVLAEIALVLSFSDCYRP